jgi:SepF-like predicted cell division protein (DUF552 family)
MEKQNRTRSIELIVRVTDEEKKLIYEKMSLLGTRNYSAYIRKMAIDGYIINLDLADVKEHAAQIQRIGVNINQIAKRLNETGSAYAGDIAEIKAALAGIWKSERQLLLKFK